MSFAMYSPLHDIKLPSTYALQISSFGKSKATKKDPKMIMKNARL